MLGLGNSIISGSALEDAFSLTSISGLQAWYKFNTNLTYSGTSVTAWADSSGNGNDLTQTTATNQGVKTSPVGGVHLDGNDNFMALDTALDLTTFTVFACITLDGTSLETLFGNGSNGNDWLRLNGSTWTIRTLNSSNQAGLTTAKGATDSYVLTLFTEVGASSTKYTLRATDEGDEGNGTINNQVFTIGDLGRNSAGAYYFDGKVLELAIYNTELSQAQMETIETDIANRTGI